MKNVSEIYSAEWFEHFKDLKDEFNMAADGIHNLWPKTDTILDVGCGPAYLLERLGFRGHQDLWGFDGSEHARPLMAGWLLQYVHTFDLTRVKDVSTQGPCRKKHNLVICTEVAEHLDAQHADLLVDFLVSRLSTNDSGKIIFTAAPPGQGGHDHVNEQPMDYWLGKFAKHSMNVNYILTDRLRQQWACLDKLAHMRRNVVVLG